MGISHMDPKPLAAILQLFQGKGIVHLLGVGIVNAEGPQLAEVAPASVTGLGLVTYQQ
jgi:hypothetical protein